jgi:DNA processing protein
VKRAITSSDPEWPACLKELAPHDPPARLFLQGRRLDLSGGAIAVVGTRRPTGAGIEIATAIAQGLAEAGLVVVSGMAVGIDAAAHRAALEAGGHTIAVLGCGLDVAYPYPNRKLKARIAEQGTLVSEYEEGTSPTRFTFPRRNRIIAGLTQGVVVVEGSLRSGALVTARLALDANRNVYAVPGSVRNPMARGPNELIRTGRAALATGVEHIFEDLAPGMVWERHDDTRDGQSPAADEIELAVLAALDDSPLPPDRFGATLGLKPGLLAATLARLEVKDLVERSPGGYALTTRGRRVSVRS